VRPPGRERRLPYRAARVWVMLAHLPDHPPHLR